MCNAIIEETFDHNDRMETKSMLLSTKNASDDPTSTRPA